MWSHLDPRLAKLDQIFGLLIQRTTQYNFEWSIAELKISDNDLQWLNSWFQHLTTEKLSQWYASSALAELQNGKAIMPGQMLGSLLICAGSEECREKSSESSVWPTFRRILPKSLDIRSELFLPNGQPTNYAKGIIRDAVRLLNIRNVIDIEGTQQWFITIKLQYGFTYRGAKFNLAKWLVNLGKTDAVQYLLGESEYPELTSKSFQTMWRALLQYRRGLINELEVLTTLEKSPWIKSHWIEELLGEAKSKIATLGTGESLPVEFQTYEEEYSIEEVNPVTSISLDWPKGISPRLRFNLNRQAIEDEFSGTDLGELDFYIDGRKLSRWIRQRDGSWEAKEHIYAEPEKYMYQPNLRPHMLCIESGEGKILHEWDFADSGLFEEVLVFDLDNSRMLNASKEQLEQNRHYAIICDRKCEIHGCEPVETFEQKGIVRKVIRLPTVLDENLRISYEDFELWQPIQPDLEPRQHFPLILSTPKGKTLLLDSRSILTLEGLPKPAESVKLLVHTETHEMLRDKDTWRTPGQVTMTPELAARQRRVRLRFSLNDKSVTQKPRLSFNLLGTAMLRNMKEETVSYNVLNEGACMNPSEGTTYLRVWTPENDKRAVVFEGNCRVGRLQHNKIRLREFPGHGGELHVLSQGKRFSLGVSCIDTGCVQGFRPLMLGYDGELRFHSEKNLEEIGDDGYSVYAWLVSKKNKAKLYKLPSKSILPGPRNRVCRIRDSCNPISIALTWKGKWLGSYCNPSRVQDYINNRVDLPLHDFRIMKWFRIPVLHQNISSTFANAVARTPCDFIKAWSDDRGLPAALKPHDNIRGVDSIIRRFLWNDFPKAHAQKAISIVTKRNGGLHHIEQCISCLNKLSDISPVLLWSGMEKYLIIDASETINILRNFAHSQVNLSINCNQSKFNKRLQKLREQASYAIGISHERLEEIIFKRIKSMQKRQWSPQEDERDDLLRIGETLAGRRYVSARMSQYWLDLSSK